MKIAIVIPKYGLVGGAEAYACELAGRLVDQEHIDIHVFANKWRSGTASITFHKIPIINFPRTLRQISFAYYANKYIDSNHYDIIHSHDRIFHMDLLTMHGLPHETWVKTVRCKSMSPFDRSMTWVEKKALVGAPPPMVLAVSTLVRDAILRQYQIPEDAIRIMHPGIAQERFLSHDPKKYRHEIRARFGLSSNDLVILFVGMNFQVKQLDLVMRGMADLKKRGLGELKLLVVGKGNREAYIKLSHELEISDQVYYAGVTHHIEKYYMACDVFAMPSRFDTFGMVVLEAMMARLPVIISDTVGAKDIVDNGVQGFILKNKITGSEFSHAMGLLLDPDVRKKMGERAQRTALQHTWSDKARQTAAIYRELLSKADGLWNN